MPSKWRALSAGLFVLATCSGSRTALQHPLTNELDPSYGQRPIRTLALLPFATDVGQGDDPDALAAPMIESEFVPALNAATGFTLLPSNEVQRMIEQEGLGRDLAKFYKNWISDQTDVDEGFIRRVAALMKTDGVVAGAVDLWHQDVIDMMQTGAARTSVGVLVGLFDGATGKRLWLGRDANFKDGIRYPGPDEENRQELERQLERTNLRTVGGMYAPPDFSQVVDLVIGPLVEAFPRATP
jgi:hypothetical protein